MQADANGIVPDLPPGDAALRVFRSMQSLLHSVLVIHYRFTEENAREAEADLEVWLERMSRRSPGRAEPATLRESLLALTCEYARSTQLWRLEGKPSGDPRFDRFLARDPREVAAEIARRIKNPELRIED